MSDRRTISVKGEAEMYIDPFIGGVLATIVTELVSLFAYAIYKAKK